MSWLLLLPRKTANMLGVITIITFIIILESVQIICALAQLMTKWKHSHSAQLQIQCQKKAANKILCNNLIDFLNILKLLSIMHASFLYL